MDTKSETATDTWKELERKGREHIITASNLWLKTNQVRLLDTKIAYAGLAITEIFDGIECLQNAYKLAPNDTDKQECKNQVKAAQTLAEQIVKSSQPVCKVIKDWLKTFANMNAILSDKWLQHKENNYIKEWLDNLINKPVFFSLLDLFSAAQEKTAEAPPSSIPAYYNSSSVNTPASSSACSTNFFKSISKASNCITTPNDILGNNNKKTTANQPRNNVITVKHP